MEIPPKRTGRPAKYDLCAAEIRRFVRCSDKTRESIRTGYLTRARVTGVKITTRAVKGGLMIYRLESSDEE